jgi:hypothetical protein
MVPLLKFSEVRRERAQFQYGYYTSDEYLNEDAETLNSSNLYEKSLYRRLTGAGKFPRQVKITGECQILSDEEIPTYSIDLDLSTTKILYEGAAASFSTTGLTVSDSAISTKAYQLLRQNVQAGQTLTVPTPISPNLYRSVSNSSFAAGISVFNLIRQTDVTTDPLDKLSGLPVDITISRLFAGDIVGSSTRDYSNIFADELASLTERAETIQASSASRTSQQNILSSELDYVIDDEYVNHGYSFSKVTHVGFIFEKQRISSSPDTEDQADLISTVFVNSPRNFEYIDRKVAMKYSYVYKIRSVYGVPIDVTVTDISAEGLEFDRTSKATVFVASEGKIVRVNPFDSLPPPPPQDLVVTSQIYPRFGLFCNWRMPSSTQFDVVGFLVFRRDDQSQPFKQIATIDFDSTQGRTETLSKRYPCKNIIRSSRPILSFVDEDVSPDKDYIYAACSVDAHNNISSYSVQLRARYVKATNQTIVRAFSMSGAPLAYPNILMDEVLFTDLIKVSSVKKISLALNPDFKFLEKEDGISEQMILTNDESSTSKKYYRLNLIDLNTLSQNNFDFNISSTPSRFTNIDASTKTTQVLRDFIEIT